MASNRTTTRGNRGRFVKLDRAALRKLDGWMQRKPGHTRKRLVPIKVICFRLGVASRTVYDGFQRVGAYRDCPR